VGVCGKQPDTAALQDLLIYALKGLSLYALEGRRVGVKDTVIDHFTCEAIFSTLTNVNFDGDRFVGAPLLLRHHNRSVETQTAGSLLNLSISLRVPTLLG
jgi:hydroxylamine reductase (hybrid-cluster protein)